MSVTGFSSDHNNKIYKNPSHWRKNSGELDVFEASKYFSSATDQNPSLNRHNIIPTRMSLDMPIMRNPIIPPEFHHVGLDQKQPKLENKKYKQPSSPGGRLASFLNSLFNQTSLKKKKSKPGKDFDDENTPGPGRRKRRSSISHFRIITSSAANSSAASDHISRSGFRTPPPYADTPTKSYKAISLLPAGKGGNFKTTLQDELCVEKNDEKTRAPGKNDPKNLDFGFRKFDDGDDGADSDSSSDLFDLPNHDLDFYSSGLPVYETTHMDRIKLVAPISRATTV
ncbi:hypothetical protein PHJA_000873100 [Phtheirospermum japonicum]|uniref:Protein BIG GRAIN 1-like E n=1 Tax=Phtheirospermum japonicum TaxID=374723 RepID=A0A830BS59_9LAMI|nr:hypothetical protein PHJA_000873100 [Phtheirospermum japonicum]